MMDTSLNQLAAELNHLRRAFREALSTYGARIEGHLSLVEQALQDHSQGERSEGIPRIDSPVLDARVEREIREMLETVKDTKLKPSKGRRKDLRRVEDLAKDLFKRLEDW